MEYCHRKLPTLFSLFNPLPLNPYTPTLFFFTLKPPDVIKSRIQAAPAGTYKGFMDCAGKIVSQEGPQALFKGLGPALLRAFPVK